MSTETIRISKKVCQTLAKETAMRHQLYSEGICDPQIRFERNVPVSG